MAATRTATSTLSNLLTLDSMKPEIKYPSYNLKGNVMKPVIYKPKTKKEEEASKSSGHVMSIEDSGAIEDRAEAMLRQLVQANPQAAMGITGDYGTKVVKPSESSMLFDLMRMFEAGELGSEADVRAAVARGASGGRASTPQTSSSATPVAGRGTLYTALRGGRG